MARQGNIVVNSDEWTLSDPGFSAAPDAERFVLNLASWLTGGKKGKLHAYSNNYGLLGRRLANALRAAGHTFTSAANIPFTLDALMEYDGIFLAGNTADNDVLIDYVRAGRGVYLAAGTGWGSAASEARRWNRFLGTFGLALRERYDGVSGKLPAQDDHPLFDGVGSLFYSNGNDIVALDPNVSASAVLLAHRGKGHIAIFDSALADSASPVPVSPRPEPAEPEPEPAEPEPEPAEPEIRVRMTKIHYKGKVKRTQADEYVEITNEGAGPADISGWKISGGNHGQVFVFPEDTVLDPGQVVRVYTNQIHPEHGGFSYRSRRALWNNKGGAGTLSNAEGEEISGFRYGNKA